MAVLEEKEIRRPCRSAVRLNWETVNTINWSDKKWVEFDLYRITIAKVQADGRPEDADFGLGTREQARRRQ
jgi:hypothetical protein